MPSEYLVDTNILIYHTNGSEIVLKFIDENIKEKSLNISILTKIEFLGWDKHTPEGLIKCIKLVDHANVYYLDENIADKTIELKKKVNIKLADAVIAATALLNGFKLVTRNIDDYKMLDDLILVNPFDL
jgi:predicted nucleic acid-binding protein